MRRSVKTHRDPPDDDKAYSRLLQSSKESEEVQDFDFPLTVARPVRLTASSGAFPVECV